MTMQNNENENDDKGNDDTRSTEMTYAVRIQNANEESNKEGEKDIHSELLVASVPIVLCTGFDSSESAVLKPLVQWNNSRGSPLLSQECDESTITPGLFVCGPMVHHTVERKSTKNGKKNEYTETETSDNGIIVEQKSKSFIPESSLASCSLDRFLPLHIIEKRKKSLPSDEDESRSNNNNKKEELVFCFIYKY
eukprot:15329777-Ditylum_brightwellii.AAC.1